MIGFIVFAIGLFLAITVAMLGSGGGIDSHSVSVTAQVQAEVKKVMVGTINRKTTPSGNPPDALHVTGSWWKTEPTVSFLSAPQVAGFELRYINSEMALSQASRITCLPTQLDQWGVVLVTANPATESNKKILSSVCSQAGKECVTGKNYGYASVNTSNDTIGIRVAGIINCP